MFENHNLSKKEISQNEFLKIQYELNLKLSEIQCKLDESEEKKLKIEFDNRTLKMQIDSLKEDKENEIKLLKKVQDKEKETYNKTIENLKQQLNESYLKLNKKNLNNEDINKNNNNKLFSQIKDYEKKLRKSDDENFNLRKENQKLKNKIGELNIIINSKEELNQQLKSDYENTLEALKEKTDVYEQNYYQQNEKYDEDTINTINTLTAENERLLRENEQFKANYAQINNNAIESNNLFNQKKQEFETTVQKQKKKLIEYKHKIASLKMKINELYDELHNSYNNNNYNTNNNNINNNINYNSNNSNYNSSKNLNRVNTFESNSDRDNIHKEKIKIPNIPKSNNKGNSTKNLDISHHSKNNSSIILNFENSEDTEQLKFLEKYKQTLSRVDEDLKKLGVTVYNK